MTCPNCGATVADNRRFCGKCGTALSSGAPAASSGAAVPPAMPPAGGPPSTWGPGGATPPPPPVQSPSSAPAAGPPAGAPDPFAPPNLGSPNLYAPSQYPPPGYPPPGYGPPGQYPPPGYAGAPGAGPGYAQMPPHTSGLSIASLILGIVGWLLCGVGSVVAIVLGFIARDQIKRSWGRETGAGMAMAGIVLGFVGVGLWVLIFVLSLVHAGSGG